MSGLPPQTRVKGMGIQQYGDGDGGGGGSGNGDCGDDGCGDLVV